MMHLKQLMPTSPAPIDDLITYWNDASVYCLGEADTDRSPLLVRADVNMIMTGTTGSGKTNAVLQAAIQEAMTVRTAIVAFDGHNQFQALDGRLTARWETQEEQVAGLRWLYSTFLYRQQHAVDASQAQLVPDNKSWYTKIDYRIVVFLDETSDFTGMLIELDRQAERRRDPEWRSLVEMFALLVSGGRKVGIKFNATTTKYTNQLSGDSRITIGFPTKIMFRPDDTQHAKLGLGLSDDRDPELETSRWNKFPGGHGATLTGWTPNTSVGLIRFQASHVLDVHLEVAVVRARELGIEVPPLHQLNPTMILRG